MDFSDSHAGINFLVRDRHPDKTIMLLMGFSFFSDFKFLLFFKKQNMNAEGMHKLTHTQIFCIINQSVAHLLACSVCFFPINKALIAFSLECDLACCMLSLD